MIKLVMIAGMAAVQVFGASMTLESAVARALNWMKNNPVMSKA
ncbi:hypothetical protein P9H32_13765 [Pontiella sp. NLcol2]|uniref:Uncharacterized protein n=1 Tax=Pontiella agarivorans TaxID=3038953 RepID=A0ABU5MZS5_9BACT|nr:hypothetical protein [Pontiella agarivorans]